MAEFLLACPHDFGQPRCLGLSNYTWDSLEWRTSAIQWFTMEQNLKELLDASNLWVKWTDEWVND